MSNSLPALSAGGVVTFTGGTSQVAVDPTFTINDPLIGVSINQNGGSGALLTGATVSIGAGFIAGDTLTFTNQNGITGSYEATTGVLTLTGAALSSFYQGALRSITYSFSPSTDDPTDGQTDTSRVVSWSITDGASATTQVISVGGGYAAPQFLAVDANGTVYVTDDGNAPSITALALNNGSYAHPPTPLTNPAGLLAGIAVDNGGNLFIASNVSPGSPFSEAVEIFAPTYQTSNTFFTPLTTDTFVGIAVDAHDNVFIVDQTTRTIFEAKGPNFSPISPIFVAPAGVVLQGIAVDASGNLFIAEHAGNGTGIMEVTAASGYQGFILLGAGSFTAPTGIAIDSHGDVFVTDTATNSVKELLGPNYATVVTIDSTHFLHPTGIAVDAQGDIFVADTGHHAVAEILAPATSTIDLEIAPVVTAGASATFTGGGSAVVLDSALTITDQASTPLTGATVTISSGYIAGDLLKFTNPGGLSSGFSNGVLTLSGSASLATYQAALQSVTYSVTAGADPTGGGSDTTRAISWSVTDGTHASNAATSTLTTAHAPPSVSVVGSATPFTLGFAPVPLASHVTVSDPDSGGNLAGATVQITGGTFAGDGDLLAAVIAGTSISASYNKTTETLTLSGSDTFAHYQQVLASVSFTSTSSDPAHGGADASRTVTWTVDDGNTSNHLASTTQTLAIDVPPVVTAGATATFTGGISMVALDPTLSLAGSATLAGAVVQITAGFKTGDTLNFASQNGITASYDATHGLLTLTGSASLAAYQAALQSVTYSFAPTTSDPADGGTDAARVITWAVTDGTTSSTPIETIASGFLSAQHLAIDANGTLYVTSNTHNNIVERDGVSLVPLVNGIYGSPVVIETDINLLVRGITVGPGGNVFVTEGNPAPGSFNVLEASPPGYAVRSSLLSGGARGHFFGMAHDASGNLFVADDGNGVVIELTAASGYTAHQNVYTGDGPADVAVDAHGNLFVLDDGTIHELTAASGFINDTTIGLSGVSAAAAIALDAHGDLFVTDQASGTVIELLGPDYATAITVATGLNGPEGIALDANGNIFVVENGSGDVKEIRAPATSPLNIVLAPVVTAGATTSFAGGSSAVALDSSLTVTDQGSATLTGATISISTGFLTGDTLNFTDQGGITGQYDAPHGILTLSGTVSVSAYQTALESITYGFTPANGDPTSGGTDTVRAISWVVNDAAHVSSAATSLLTTSHTPPSLSVTGTPVFTKGFGPILLDPSVSVTDPDSNGMLVGATVKVGGGLFGDTLAATTAGTSITASYDILSDTLTLTGSDTIAHYNQVLQSITFNTTNGDPTQGGAAPTHTVSWTVDDGSASNHIATATQSLDVVVPPTVTAGASAAFTGGASHVALDPTLVLHDTESTTLAGATVNITTGFTAGDTLNFTNQNGITGHYDAAHGILTLSGRASVSAYQTALQSVTYSFTPATSDPTHGGTDTSRVITWTVDDGISSSTPAATISSGYLGPDSIAVDANGTVYLTDAITANLTDLPLVNGVYAFTPTLLASLTLPSGIIVGQGGALWVADTTVREFLPPAYTTVLAPNGGLTGFLKGIAQDTHGNIFVANENAGVTELLASTGYGQGIPIPQTGNFPTALALDASNNLFVFTVGTATLREFTAASGYSTPITIATFTSQVTGLAFDAHGDLFAATAFDGIVEFYGPNYATSVTYNAPFIDTVHGIAFDAAGDMFAALHDAGVIQEMLPPAVSTLNIVLAPVVTAGATAAFIGGGSPVALDPSLTVTDQQSATLSSATVSITAGFLSGDKLNFANQGGITGQYDAAHGVLTLSGTASVNTYQTALESITYSFASGNDPTGGGTDVSRAISWMVNDGIAASSAAASVLTVAPALTFTSPAIIGTAQEGQTLTAPAVGGSGTPSYTWFSSVDNYTSPIGTGPTYLVQEADETHTIEVQASVTIGGIPQTITSLPTDTVIDAAPIVTTPTISGLEQAGHALTASASGNNTLTYAWFSSADGFTHPIGTGASYVVQTADVSHALEVTATVTNDNGITASASATVPTQVAGTSASETFTATAGNERIDGNGGTDTVIFNFKLTDAVISFLGNEVIVDTASSHTVLTGMSVYKFTDGTVNERTGITGLVKH